jgi:hypothetical protein
MLPQLDVTTKPSHDMSKPVEVLRCRIGQDVAVLAGARRYVRVEVRARLPLRSRQPAGSVL